MSMVWAGMIFILLCGVNRRHRKRLGALGTAAVITILFGRPPQAQGQDLIAAIQVVLTTINSTIGDWLTSIRTVETNIQQTQQASVWPKQMIQQAQAWATSWMNTYAAPMRQLHNYRPASATRQSAQDLEQVLTNKSGTDLSTLQSRYQQLYGSVPADGQMKPQDRDMTDMDDALAQDTLEQLKRGDQVNQKIQATGDALEQMSTTAAPGTSSFVTATALVTMLKSQAVTQKMVAAYLRQTSAQLAHETAGQKAAIQATIDLQQTIGHTQAR